MKSTFGYSPSKFRRSSGIVPTSIERIITFTAAIWVTGRSSDHCAPAIAPINELDACADAISASRVNATSLINPVLPLVPTTMAIFLRPTQTERLQS